MRFGDEKTFQVAKLFMTSHASRLISKEDVRSALDKSIEYGQFLEPPEVYLDAEQLGSNLATRQKRTRTKLEETRRLVASKADT